ncbi:glycosyltransferase involved in cell wall biosynthesis [Methylohalomonas lacus]|uniref:Glycosyltransferase involved in cell wall biosynthesis n=1 Tax=Methylohalomonas lacus TaxID=398773 RepID=A0AAE3HN10_9GAMM|nr:glycosyltransferase family 4 protein [Methylohalomonas lacus]MCS3904383.1 glycosyltransferase involved in cell wall biosynthesis [Methylohalomonas lacus]
MQFPVPSETFASLEVNTLCEMGHELTVYALRTPHRLFKKMINQRNHDAVRIVHFRLCYIPSALLSIILQPRTAIDLLLWLIASCYRHPKRLGVSLLLMPVVMWHFSIIRKNPPDIAHLFWGHYPSLLGYLIYRYLPGVKLTQFLGAHDLITNHPSSFILANKLGHVITHSNYNIDLISANGVSREYIHVVHRGTQVSDVPSSSEKFRDISAPRFLSAGRLINTKGMNDVISIFHHVISLYPNARLTIAGDGPERKNLESLVGSLGLGHAVDFVGHVPQKQLFSEMTSAHFFLLMTRYGSERLPNVIKEAMLRQCVVITSQMPAIDELVSDMDTGFVVHSGDNQRAVKCIEKCLGDQEYAMNIADRAQALIINNFDIRKSMKRYMDYWNNYDNVTMS